MSSLPPPRFWERLIGARVNLTFFGIVIGTGNQMLIHHNREDTDNESSEESSELELSETVE